MRSHTLKEALDLIDGLNLQPSAVEMVSMEDSVGRVLAKNLTWDRDHPPYNRAAMDGYAFPGKPECGVRYPVVGSSRAGEPYQGLVPEGSCVKIATGAMVPESCHTVVAWEQTQFCDEWVELNTETDHGKHIHLKGSDHEKGAIALCGGQKLGTLHQAVLATIGAHQVPVHSKVRVLFLSTGSELVPVEQDPEPHQIRASNFYAIKQLLASNPSVKLVKAAFLEDTFSVLHSFLNGEQADLILVTGGVGTSEYDLVPELANKLGYSVLLHGLAIKPGHPVFLARKGNSLMLGLPGNPVSAAACYLMFAQRILSQFQGGQRPVFQEFIAGEDLINKGKRLLMRPCRFEGKSIFEIPWNGSGDVSAIHPMTGLALINAKTTISTGEPVQVLLWEGP